MACGNQESFSCDDDFHLPKSNVDPPCISNSLCTSVFSFIGSSRFKLIICLSSSLPLGFLFLAEVLDSFSFSVLDYEVAYKSDKLGFLSIYSCLYKPTKFYILRSA